MREADRVRGERLYRWVLRIYPKPFRLRYSGRLVDAFRRQRTEHVAAGGGAVSFWLGILVDAAGSAARLHLERLRERLGSSEQVPVSQPAGGKEPLMATVLSDVRYAWRSLWRKPSFAVAALATITMAVAASTAAFSVVDAVLIRPLPFAEPERLVYLAERNPEQVGTAVSPETFRDWEREARTFAGFAVSAFNSRVYREGSRAEVLTVVDVNDAFFEVLGRGAAVGRVFGKGEGSASEWLAVLGDSFWRSRFGADPAVLGRVIRLDDRMYTIVGVMPGDFAIPGGDVPVWTLETWAGDTGRAGRYLAVVGRLAPGHTAEQADTELNAIARRLAEQFPSTNEGWRVGVRPLHEALTGSAAPPLRLIGVSVGLLLLVGCFNVAGLMLARSASRRREIAVRQALGGGWRILRLLGAETMLIAALGGVLGVMLANLLVQAVVANPPVEIPLIETVSIDGRALGFAVAAVVLTGLVFGLTPALLATRTEAGGVEVLRTATGTAPQRRSPSAQLRSALVAAEIAVAVVLVIGAALLLRSLLALDRVDPGFETDNRIAARVFLDAPAYRDAARRTAWVRDVQANAAALPGVTAAGTISVLPMDPVSVNLDLPYRTAANAGTPAAELPQAEFRVASGEIFEALGVDLVQGRAFTDADDDEAPRVIVINESLAERAFPDGRAVGQRMAVYWGAGSTYEVIGVVEDTRQAGLTGSLPPQLYVHFPQLSLPFGSTNLVVAAEGNASALVRAVDDAVRSADPAQPAHSVIMLESLVSDSIARERFATTLLTGLAAFSLALAALGLYGLVSFVVRQRTRELAIRMALGARRVDALGTVLRQSLVLALWGAVIGVAAARAGARLVESLLFEVSAVDPLTYALVPVALVGVALLAAARPAWTAANADPLSALRED